VLLGNVKSSAHSLVECTQCGLRFFEPRLGRAWVERQIAKEGVGRTPAERHAKFGTMSEPPPGHNTERQVNILRVHYRKVLDDIRETRAAYIAEKYGKAPVLVEELRVLDVGCGVGWATKMFREHNAAKNSAGIELCPHAAGFAKRMHSVDVTVAPFRDAKIRKVGRFDVIFMNDYIEHTYNPYFDLRRAVHYTRNFDALLYVKTFAEEKDEKHGRVYLDPPWHAYHIKTDVLKAMVTAAGWDILRVKEHDCDQVSIIASVNTQARVKANGGNDE
jgi:SAM-dependent methyltransferase